MFRRIAVATLVFAGISAAPWSIQDVFAQVDALEPVTESVASAAAAVQFAATEQSSTQVPRAIRRQTGRSWSAPVMAALHATTMAAQMMDVHSTIQALNTGGVEANPMMSGLVKNRAAFIGVKAAMGAGLVLATHKMAQRNKVAAIVTSVAVNSVILTVAHHNYKVARMLR